ncbi:MAG TPA: UbiD family decarboxylase [Thermodesulfobacteriota bacterium]|nr:UbiD family decarboxylase [Thermodesulfobacteriota bacterium]
MQTLGDWLSHLDKRNRLAVINPGVSLKFELSGILDKLEASKSCFFPSPGNHSIPVVGGLLIKRSWVAEALNTRPENVLNLLEEAMSNPIPWKEVPQEQAPVHEVIHDGDIDILKLLPVVTHNEKDVGPYITAGLVHARNPETGKQNVSIHRMQVHAPNKLGILMLPRDLYAYFSMAEAKNKPLQITITIGHYPSLELASQVTAPRDLCELHIAGALHGKPVRVVKSYTNDVCIPADAEISIEGCILPNIRAPEGPFGEFPKYYSDVEMQPVIEIKCITHRKNPIYRTINAAGHEMIVIGKVPREAFLIKKIKSGFPNVLDLRLTRGGLGRYHLIIQMKKKQYGEAKNLISYAFGCHHDIKQVIVVDEDINIHDSTQVEWAVATRFQAHRDLVVLHHSLGSKLDPSTDERGVGSKMGIDATKYLGDEERFYVTKIPGEENIDIEDVVQNNTKTFRDYIRKDKGYRAKP